MRRGLSWPLPLVLTLLCIPLAFCIKDAPVVAFLAPGSTNNMLDALPADKLHTRGPYLSAQEAVEHLTLQRRMNGKPALCDLDALVHVQVDSLDHESFAPLQITSPLRKRMLVAPSQLVLSSVDQSVFSFYDELESTLSALCDSTSTLKDRIFPIRVPSVDGHDSDIMVHIEHIDSKYPNNAVVVSRTPQQPKAKRAVPLEGNLTFSKGSFLRRNQLFSSSTVLSIGVVAFLLFCTIIAVHMISTTEAPDRLGTISRTAAYSKKRN